MTSRAKGFTLVETIIYLGILGILLLAIGAVLFQTLRGGTKAQTLVELGENAQTLLADVSSRISSAQSVTLPTQGTSGNSLELAVSDTEKTPTTITLVSGVVTLTEGANAPVALQSPDVVVSDLLFQNVSYPDQPGSIRVSFTMSGASGVGQEYQASETFFTTATVRNK